jgi:lipoyl(octanoyl) transferase
VQFRDLGRIPFAQGWDLQTRLHQELVDRKRSRWRGEEISGPIPHTFLLCEHPPVFTLGKSGSEDHLQIGEEDRKRLGFDYFRINRGGDITYHGPGQIVGYPILDLEEFYCDVHRYVRELEEVIIRVLSVYGIYGERFPSYTGVWLAPQDHRPWRKICAIGVHLSRWVTLHGFAFNVQTDLSHFHHIIPCGIRDKDKSVTSLALELGWLPEPAEVRNHVIRCFSEVFQCDLQSDL